MIFTKNIHIGILFFVSSLLLTSCDDFLTTIVEVDLPEHEPQLVVSLQANTLSERIKVTVTKTISAADRISIEDQFVNNATVTLESSTGESYEFVFDTDYSSTNYILNQAGIIKEGNTYTLTVEAPGFETVTGTQTIPSRPKVTAASVIPDDIIDPNGNLAYSLNFIMEDDLESEDFYSIRLFCNRNGILDYQHIKSYDPAINEGYLELLVSDLALETKENNIQCYFHKSTSLECSYVLEWSHITKDQYKFSKLYKAQFGNNPFTSPIRPYSNMSNGFGIFALSNTVAIIIE